MAASPELLELLADLPVRCTSGVSWVEVPAPSGGLCGGCPEQSWQDPHDPEGPLVGDAEYLVAYRTGSGLRIETGSCRACLPGEIKWAKANAGTEITVLVPLRQWL